MLTTVSLIFKITNKQININNTYNYLTRVNYYYTINSLCADKTDSALGY